MRKLPLIVTLGTHLLAAILGAMLLPAIFRGEMSDQPSYKDIPPEQLPQHVRDKITTAFPSTKLDMAWEVSSWGSEGYRVFFSDANGNYSLETLGPRGQRR